MPHSDLPRSKWFSNLLLTGLILAALAAFTLPAVAQERPVVRADTKPVAAAEESPAAEAEGKPATTTEEKPVVVGNSVLVGVADDWSHHHAVFADPGTEEDAIKNGRYNEWLKTTTSPRYIQQQLKRSMAVRGPAAEEEDMRNVLSDRIRVWRNPISRAIPPRLKEQVRLETDWSMSLNASTTTGTGTAGVANFPAKFSFYTLGQPSCNDFVVYPTGLTGTGANSQPTLIAYNNLYTGCAANVPTIYWQYNTAYPQGSTTADGSTITTSPVLVGPVNTSAPYVAFIQSTSAGVASLVLLKYASNSSLVQLDTAATNVTPAQFYNCNGGSPPCMTRIALDHSTTGGDANSSPFYDYTNDAIYVGDTQPTGTDPYIHKFIHIYTNSSSSPPSECTTVVAGCSTTTAFPVSAGHDSGGSMSSPVMDESTGDVYWGLDDGRAGWVSSTTGALIIQSTADVGSTGTGIVDGPLVDTSTGTSEVYFTADGGVWQFAGGFAASATGTERTVGTGSTTANYYSGSFDNLYFDAPTTAAPNSIGHLYVCSTSSGTGIGTPELYAINLPFSTTSTVTALGTIASAAAGCAPVSEFLGSKANTTLSAALATVAQTTTTTTAAMTAGSTTVTVTSATGITANSSYVEVDSEDMFVTAVVGTTLTVTRGQHGSLAVAHASGATLAVMQTSSVSVASATGISTGDFIQVGTEIMYVSAIAGNTLTAYRGVLGTSPAAQSSGSAVQDIQEWLFTSITANASGTAIVGTCATGNACVLNYKVTAGIPTAPTTGTPETGGTSGIIVDNSGVSSTYGYSNVYFSTLGVQTCNGYSGSGSTGYGTRGCAIQATQSAP